ncbi:MAG TPA: sodium/proline symporter [Candidatus Babeliales bacterium]|nr:sodium/proline symporter [Candidatus Babeliales bacterium]
MNSAYIISFVAYFAFFLGLSIYFYRKNKNAGAFILGNRSVSYWVAALAAQASDMSDWLFMGYPGLIYGCGLFNAWVAIGLIIFMFLNWQFIAPKLRKATEYYESVTLASFFERRFHDHSGALRLMTVFFTLFFLSFYIAAGLLGLGRLFESTFGLSYHYGIAISIFIVVINILIGGFIAVAWGDMFRGLFLLAMILIVPVVAWSSMAIHPDFRFHTIAHALIPSASYSTLTQIITLAFGWGLGYFGSPHILINFMGIKEISKISKAKWIGISWQIIVLGAATLIGMLGTTFFAQPIANRELVFIEMVKELFHPLAAGLILCAIFAATMSVMTAQILATASNISEDFIKRIITKPLSSGASLFIIRACVVLLPLIAYAISYNSTSSVNDLVSYAWSGLGLAFAPAVIAALYMPRTNKYGASAGMLFGGITGMVWPYLNMNFMPLLPGFAIGLLLITSISYSTTSHQKN